MPNINTGILILNDDKSNQYPKEIFYKIIHKAIQEKENYEKIEKERTASLLKLLSYLYINMKKMMKKNNNILN